MLYLLHRALTSWLDRHGLYRIFGPLDQVEFRALLAAFLAFILVLLFGRRVIAWLVRMKIGDAGLSDAAALAAHSASKAKTPTMGGILIVGAILTAVLLLADLSRFHVQVGVLLTVLYAALGASDDWLKLTASRRGTGSRQGLHAWEKLVFQVGLAAIIGYFCARQPSGPMTTVLNLPFQRTYVPGSDGQGETGLIFLSSTAFVLITALFITGMSNAVNITDGMDGLAAGVSGIVSLGLFVLTLIAGYQSFAYYLLVPHVDGAGELAVFAGAMGGACLGFLWWNCSPAAVFMGDTGSLAIGALIGYIAMVIRQEAAVLLMSVIFIIEAGSVMLQVGYFKWTRGKRIFRCAPYHHHLHLSSWTEQQIVARFWIITILAMALALGSVKMR